MLALHFAHVAKVSELGIYIHLSPPDQFLEDQSYDLQSLAFTFRHSVKP